MKSHNICLLFSTMPQCQICRTDKRKNSLYRKWHKIVSLNSLQELHEICDRSIRPLTSYLQTFLKKHWCKLAMLKPLALDDLRIRNRNARRHLYMKRIQTGFYIGTSGIRSAGASLKSFHRLSGWSRSRDLLLYLLKCASCFQGWLIW